MASKGWTSYNQLLEYFVLKVDDILRSHGSTPVHWEEVFKAGAKVDSDVIFEVWTSQSQIKSVVQSQYRVIAAPSDVWYLEYVSLSLLPSPLSLSLSLLSSLRTSSQLSIVTQRTLGVSCIPMILLLI
jgi:hypothetical protein